MADSGNTRKRNIRWGRVILAAVMSEVAVILLLLAVILVYSRWITPGLSDAAYQDLGQRIGYYVAPTAGFVSTFLFVLWVARKLSSDFVANGIWVGIVSVLLTFAFIFSAKSEDRAMYVIAFALRIIAGYAGGLVSQRRRGAPRETVSSTA